MLRVYPVLDLRGGIAVHAVRGERERYQPLASELVASSRPLDVALAIRDRYRLDSLYVADLDALTGGADPSAAIDELIDNGFQLMVDAGVRTAACARRQLDAGVTAVIVALETARGPDELASVVEAIGRERAIFSLDLRAGRALAQGSSWPTTDPAELVAVAESVGYRRIIVLDLAAVGTRSGPASLDLVEALSIRHPEIEISTGGGVRSPRDLDLLERAGAKGALIGTALHDGSLLPKDLARTSSH